MATLPDYVIAAVLRYFRDAGDEGLSIATIFNKAQGEFGVLDEPTTNATWTDLRGRKDVFWLNAEGDEVLICDSPFSKMTLADVRTLGLFPSMLYYERLRPAGSKRKAEEQDEARPNKRRSLSPEVEYASPNASQAAVQAPPEAQHPAVPVQGVHVESAASLIAQDPFHYGPIDASGRTWSDLFKEQKHLIAAYNAKILHNMPNTSYVSPYASLDASQPTISLQPQTAQGALPGVADATSAQTLEPSMNTIIWTDVLSPQTSVPPLPFSSVTGTPKPLPQKGRKLRSPRQQPSASVLPSQSSPQSDDMEFEYEREQTSLTPTLQPLHFARKRRMLVENADEPPTRKHRANDYVPVQEAVPELALATEVDIPAIHPPTRKPQGNNYSSSQEAAADLALAAEVKISRATSARLSCIFNGVGGNLIIYRGENKLEFVPTVPPTTDKSTPALPLNSTPTTDHSIFQLLISRISEVPILSVRGSTPMEFRIKADDGSGKVITHSFTIADFDDDFIDDAPCMRDIIKKLMIEYAAGGSYGAGPKDKGKGKGPTKSTKSSKQLKSTETPKNSEILNSSGIPKTSEAPKRAKKDKSAPRRKDKHTCQKCGKEYKQMDGLLYHLTKGNTPCNPNADLTGYYERKARAEKRKAPVKHKKSPRSSRTVSKTAANNEVEVQANDDEALSTPTETATPMIQVPQAEQTRSIANAAEQGNADAIEQGNAITTELAQEVALAVHAEQAQSLVASTQSNSEHPKKQQSQGEYLGSAVAASVPDQLPMETIESSKNAVSYASEQPQLQNAKVVADANVVQEMSKPKRGPGRPRKHAIEEAQSGAAASSSMRDQSPSAADQENFKSRRGLVRKHTIKNVETEPELASPSKRAKRQADVDPALSTHDTNSRETRSRSKSRHDISAQHEEREPSVGASSDDSVLEFFSKHTTTGVERPRRAPSARVPRTPRKTTVQRNHPEPGSSHDKTVGAEPTNGKLITDALKAPSKKYKSLPFEVPVLQEMAQQLAVARISDDAHQAEPPVSTETAITSESLAIQRCEDIILSSLNDNGAIFPGNMSIWIAVAYKWFKDFPGSDVLPESKLCTKTVDNLVHTKKVRAVDFTWFDKQKREVTRTILQLTDADVDSTSVKMMQGLIKAEYPDIYVPKAFEAPEPMQSTFNALATRKLSAVDKEKFRKKQVADEEDIEEARSQSPVQLGDESSDDEFVAGENEEAENPEEESLGDEEAEEELDWEEDEDVDIKKSGKKSKKDCRKRKGAKKGEKWTRERDAKHNKAISEGVRRNWAQRKANQPENLFPNRTKSGKQRVPLTQEEKDRRANNAYVRLHAWDTAPAYMPNPATGAWEVPIIPKKKKGGRHQFKPKMPYPITYMQAPDSTWSFQPHGHGAKPIFARPSRRANQEGLYVKRVKRDHRPVIIPTKNRKFLPAAPTRAQLGLPPVSRAPAEISKVTGKPKRVYVRKNSQQAGARSSKPRTSKKKPKNAKKIRRPRSRRFPTFVPILDAESTNKKKREKKGRKKIINEVDLLNFFEPSKLSPDAPRNVGLESLPPAFGLSKALYHGPDVEIHGFLPNYGKIKFIKPRAVTGGANPVKGSWTVNDWTPVMLPSRIRWTAAVEFDMETLPYSKLDFGKKESLLEEKAVKIRRGKQRYAPVPRAEREAMQHKFPRMLTALPNDIMGLFKTVEIASKTLGVQVGKPNRAAQFNRRIKGPRAILSEDAEKQLILAVTVLRLLTGGLDTRIDWVLIARIFQDYTLNFLEKYWKGLEAEKRDIIERLTAQFRKEFPKAYARKEVPTLNYDKLARFKFKDMLKWLEGSTKINTSMQRDAVSFKAGSREDLCSILEIASIEPEPNFKPWREQFFNERTPLFRKMEGALREPRAIARVSHRSDVDDLTHDPHVILRSWIRGVALTPKEDFDMKAAQDKLASLAEKPIVKEVLAGMQEKHTLLKNSRTRRFWGCQFEVSTLFLAPLGKTSNVQPEQFVDAAKFKWSLDQQFAQGETSVKSDYFASAGEVMVATSLQGTGQLRFDAVQYPSVGKKMGLIPGGGYETRNMDLKALIFDVNLVKNNSYLFNSDNPVLKRFLTLQPPRPTGALKDALPLWIGTTGKVIRDIWLRCLCSVGSLLVSRPAIGIEGLAAHYNITMEPWEIRLLMEWGLDAGLFIRAHPTIDGWMLSRDWFLMLGRLVDDGLPVGRGKDEFVKKVKGK